MKWGLLTQWFDPEPGPAAVPGVLARSLASEGHEVSVLTGFPNYPTGRIYSGYRQRLHQMEEPASGVTLHRVPLYPSHDGRAIARGTNYLSFFASAYLQASRWLSDVDALWVYNSPATVPAVAARLNQRCYVPYLLHVMDLWPDSVFDSGMLSGATSRFLIDRALQALVAYGYEHADGLAVTSPGQRAALMERGVPEALVHYQPLWADEEIYYPREADRSLLPEPAQQASLVWMYAGAMGYVQGIDHAIRAAARAADAGVHLVLVGHGIADADLRALARDLDARNVHFLGRRSPRTMGDLTCAADVHLVALADTPLLQMTMPSKIQSIMASGRPIIATCTGDSAQTVTESGGGIAIAPGDVEQLASALLELARSPETLNDWAAASRHYYDQMFSRAVGVGNVQALLRGMARDNRRRR